MIQVRVEDNGPFFLIGNSKQGITHPDDSVSRQGPLRSELAVVGEVVRDTFWDGLLINNSNKLDMNIGRVNKYCISRYAI
jgi:hypothetical protein